MNISKSNSPAYTLLYVTLEKDEEVFCEQGAMVAMSAGVNVKGKIEGGVTRSAMRNLLGEESFLMARYQSLITGSWVALAPKYPGDIFVLRINSEDSLIVQSGSLLGHGSMIDVDIKYSGVRNALLKEGLFSLKVSGDGLVFIASYGGIEEINLQPGEEIIVDTGHLVAWSESIDIKIGPLGGVVSQSVTGEGLVALMRARVESKVLLQTRAEQGLTSWLNPIRKENRE